MLTGAFIRMRPKRKGLVRRQRYWCLFIHPIMDLRR
jgi:hypothetical protein